MAVIGMSYPEGYDLIIKFRDAQDNIMIVENFSRSILKIPDDVNLGMILLLSRYGMVQIKDDYLTMKEYENGIEAFPGEGRLLNLYPYMLIGGPMYDKFIKESEEDGN